MRALSEKCKYAVKNDPFFRKCIRSGEGTCKGRITIEHTFIYAGRQINEPWALVPLCAFHHGVDEYQDTGDLDKEYGQYVALSRATQTELKQYPRRDWQRLWRYLQSKYEGKRDTTTDS